MIHEEQNDCPEKLAATALINQLLPYLDLKTCPKLMSSLYTHFELIDYKFRDENLNYFLLNLMNKSFCMKKFINKMVNLILDNKPLCLLLAEIKNSNWISHDELMLLQPTIQLQLNILYLFESFSVSMINSHTLIEDVYLFIMKQRKHKWTGHPLGNLFLTKSPHSSIFTRLKVITVDPAITYSAFMHSVDVNTNIQHINQLAENFKKKHGLYYWNANVVPNKIGDNKNTYAKLLSINMAEAIETDAVCNKSWAIKNAYAGAAMIADLEYNQIQNRTILSDVVLPVNEFLLENSYYSLLPTLKIGIDNKLTNVLDIQKNWRDLYTSWDLCFVATHFHNIFLPLKLLLPSVMGADPMHYMEIRVLMLFFMGNLFFHGKSDQPLFENKVTLENFNQIMHYWSDANLRYSSQLLIENCQNKTGNPKNIYENMMGKTPRLSLIKYFIQYIYSPKNFKLCSYPKPL